MRDPFSNGGGQFWTPGGFEITVSAEHQATRRDQLLSAYRQACLAQHGLHVTDRNQVILPPVLHDGSPMTPELREAIAKARAEAGKSYSAAAHRANKLDYIRDPELDGIVPKLEWEKVWKYVESTLGPPRIVKPKELPTPAGEIQRRLNAQFQDLIVTKVEEAELVAKEFLETWVVANTRRMAWWKPRTVDASWWESYGHAEFPRATQPRTQVLTATVDFKELDAAGRTFRAWFQQRVAEALADRLEYEFFHEIQGYITWASRENAMTRILGQRDPVYRIWMLDTAALEFLGKQPNELVIDPKQGHQQIWARNAFPFLQRLVMSRCLALEDEALHIELENPYSVEISPHRTHEGVTVLNRYDVTARYTGAIHVPAAAAQYCWLACIS